MPAKLLIFGPPGAGKDTQGKLLAEQFGVPFISAGRILRSEIFAKTELGNQLLPYVSRGDAVPGDHVRTLIRKRILSPAVQASGYVMNGYPRTLETLRTYLEDDRPAACLILRVDDDAVLTRRLRDRARFDDTTGGIARRIRYYREHGPGICTYLRETAHVPLLEIDAAQPVGAVTAAVKNALSRLAPIR